MGATSRRYKYGLPNYLGGMIRGKPPSFHLRVSFLFLGALALLEGASLASLAPLLQIPSPQIFEILVLITGALAMIGFAVDRRVGTGLGLLASAYEAVLGALALILHRPQVFSIQGLRGLAALSFGCATLLILYTSTRQMLTREIHEEPESPQYSVIVDDVWKRYGEGPARVEAIRRLSLGVRRGEFLAVMGPSGSGKSTLLNLLGALDRPTSGRVLIDGVDISTLNEDELARLRNVKLGFVFQSYNLVQRSKVSRNIELASLVGGLSHSERGRRVKTLLKAVGLPLMGDRKPSMLSGGEQQRVAIARALMNRPSIILADEPTGNLDSKTALEVMGFLKRMRGETGATLIMVTHNRELAKMADRIVYLRDGSVVSEEVLKGE